MFTTLVAEVDGVLTVGVVPVTVTLDLKALAAAERATGYVAGGISPLGQRRRLTTVLDASAQALETLFCSAGRRGLEVELAPGELARLTGARFARSPADRAPASTGRSRAPAGPRARARSARFRIGSRVRSG